MLLFFENHCQQGKGTPMKQQNHTLKLVYAALFLAIALVLPFLTGQIPQIGKMLSPMHFPVILCGFLCGWPWGLAVGAVAPVLRSMMFGMPQMFPMAVAMAFELAAYGAIAGIMYKILPKKTSSIYIALIIAMILGRVVYSCVQFLLLGMNTGLTGLIGLWTASVTTAVPGIILQLLIIPVLVKALHKNN